MTRAQRLREADAKPVLAGRALSDVCECGHTWGKHYALQTWPACTECEKCREFKQAARLADDELVNEED